MTYQQLPMKEIDRFLQIYRNKYLSDKIFNYIRDINQSLEYIAYCYYDFPIQSIINNNSQSHFIERLNLYHKYIVNNNNDDDSSNNTELYKYQIGFDNDLLKSCIKWKGLTLECFKSLYKSFGNEIKFYWNYFQGSINEFTNALVNNGNYKVLKYINENTDLSTAVTEKLEFDFINTSTKKITKLVNYLFIKQSNNDGEDINNKLQTLKRLDCFSYLIGLVLANKSNEFGQLFFNLLEMDALSTENNLKPQEFSQLLNVSIEKSDLTMVKLILSKFHWNKASTTSKHELVQLYEYSIRVMDLDLFLIKLSSLSTSLIDMARVAFNRFPHGYSNVSQARIIDPEVAQFITSLKLPSSSSLNIQFSHRCIKDDLSNIHLFSKETKWIVADIDILNYNKLQLFVKEYSGVQFHDLQHTQSFNGDIELYKLYKKVGGIVTCNTIICASKNKHYQLLEYLLQDEIFQTVKIQSLFDLFFYSLKNDDQLIFNKLVGYRRWYYHGREILLAKPRDMEKRIVYLNKLSKIDLERFIGINSNCTVTCSAFSIIQGSYGLLITELFIGKTRNILDGKSRVEIGNLFQLVASQGNLKLTNQLKTGISSFKKDLKYYSIKMLVHLPSRCQMLIYLISIGLLVPENQDEYELLSTHLVYLALEYNNLSAITSILNLLSKGKPFIKSNYLIDYCNLANEIHLQIFKRCVTELILYPVRVPTIHNANSTVNYLNSINYSYKPTKILLKPIEDDNFIPSTLKQHEKFEIYSKFLKNVGLFDFVFEKNNNNTTDSICLGVEKLKFTL